MEDGSINLVKLWFNKNTGKVDDRNIDTNEFETLHSNVFQLYKVRKQLRITDGKVTNYLLEDKFEANPIMRIAIPPLHRYQALLIVHAQTHWGVQRTMQQVKLVFYWPGWRYDTRFVTECAGCLHGEQVNLKNV